MLLFENYEVIFTGCNYFNKYNFINCNAAIYDMNLLTQFHFSIADYRKKMKHCILIKYTTLQDKISCLQSG